MKGALQDCRLFLAQSLALKPVQFGMHLLLKLESDTWSGRHAPQVLFAVQTARARRLQISGVADEQSGMQVVSFFTYSRRHSSLQVLLSQRRPRWLQLDDALTEHGEHVLLSVAR